MPPPNKRKRQLHPLLDVKKQNRETERIDLELADEEQVAIIDDDFDLDGLSQNQEHLQNRWEDRLSGTLPLSIRWVSVYRRQQSD